MADPRTASFPKSEAGFAQDERVSFSIVANTYILEDTDDAGTEWKWNADIGDWTEASTEAENKQLEDDFAEIDDFINATTKSASSDKKRKGDKIDKGGDKVKKQKPEAKQKEPKQQVNKAIYVSNLPDDCTLAALIDRFKRFGPISLEPTPDGGERERVKMYYDDQGVFKGDALIVYVHAGSVDQACLLADDSGLYNVMSGAKEENMKVEPADMSYKHEATEADKAKKPPKTKRELQRIREIAEKQNAEVAEWSDDDPQEVQAKPVALKPSPYIICENFFTLDKIKEDKELHGDIIDDIKDLGERHGWGKIHRITVYDLEPAGIVMIKLESPQMAEIAAKDADGLGYDGRKLKSYVSRKLERFRKTWVPKADVEDDEEARLEAYGRDISKED